MGALGAAHLLQAEGLTPALFDQLDYPGGHTASHTVNGFIFDEGPHVSFTKDQRIKDLLLANLGGEYETIDARIDNYWRGHWVTHPVITNLRGLPEELVVKVIADFVAARQGAPVEIRNYEDWLVAGYGRSYAETFPMQYTRKYHTTDAANMSTEWVGPRLYQAKLEEILTGALVSNPPNIHYVQDYRYPKKNGFAEFLRRFHERCDIHLRHKLIRIEPKARRAHFANGRAVDYDHLISSVPLPDLIPMIDGAPREVREAAARLACTTVVLVNLGVARPDVSTSSWTYFYEEEFPFSRVSFPRNMSLHTVPEGMSSIQSEIYFSKKYRPLRVSPESLIQSTIDGLVRCGILRQDDTIVLRHAQVVEYANIIFDLERAPALAVVHGYLDEVGIGYCGRYGDWGYLWTDEAFMSGEGAAAKALGRRAA
ncbi:MAG: NAD(P)-binding protein [Gemmatimonadales bacterium]|nr:NAD(P)-binding protein [Gemmatimonadales bacterium]